MPISSFADLPEDGSFIEWMEDKFCSQNDADITVGCEYNPVFRCSSYVYLNDQNKIMSINSKPCISYFIRNIFIKSNEIDIF